MTLICAGGRELHARILEAAGKLQVEHAAATGMAASAALAAAQCSRCQATEAAAQLATVGIVPGAGATPGAAPLDTEPRLAKLTSAHAAAQEELQQLRTLLACEMAVR